MCLWSYLWFVYPCNVPQLWVYDFESQGALTDLGGDWQCQTDSLTGLFSLPLQSKHSIDPQTPRHSVISGKPATGEKLMKLGERSSLLTGLRGWEQAWPV